MLGFTVADLGGCLYCNGTLTLRANSPRILFYAPMRCALANATTMYPYLILRIRSTSGRLRLPVLFRIIRPNPSVNKNCKFRTHKNQNETIRESEFII